MEGTTPAGNTILSTLLCILLVVFTYALWQKLTPPSTHGLRDHLPNAAGTNRHGFTPRSEHDGIQMGERKTPSADGIERQGPVSSTGEDTEYPSAQKTTDERPKLALRPEEYTVGWICAITVELVAAQVFLDEIHAAPDYIDPQDNNSYVLGKLGGHNTVIAALPEGRYGTTPATGVAINLLRSFPNIRIGLMVGVGGGAPSQKHDIRLGDIVISSPGNGHHGVFQYDFGKSVQGEAFHTTGFLNAPPVLLLTAVTNLKAQYEINDDRLQKTIHTLPQSNPRLWERKYKRPEPSSDVLYRSDFRHGSDPGEDCKDSCGLDPKVLVMRQARTFNDRPFVHYGLIASGNSLMRDAELRDKLGAEKGVLCFEMEAAGLMNEFPCLVIRGICDYSDTHKNKRWQPYAAVAAAGYTKDLLLEIRPFSIQNLPKTTEVLSDIRQATREHLNIARENQDLSKEREKQKCHQVFRLTTAGKDSTYEWYKDRIEKRVEGTCYWFLRHPNFKHWQQKESGPLLVSADPGCGKSVLAKYLVDEVLPGSATICYFFFKDQDQNTVRQALCALIHQLFAQKPALIEHALGLFRQNGPDLVNNKTSLWSILQTAVQDPRAGPIVLVLDALDECIGSELAELMKMISKQLRASRGRQSKLKYLLTSRPYEQVVSEFRPLLDQFPLIHIPGEYESDIISEEVNRVIVHQLDELSKEKNLSLVIRTALEKKLQEIPHRTYLWVYLVFDALRKMTIKKTRKAFETVLSKLPRNVNEAYEEILNKTEDRDMARKALSVVLVAERPLTVSEMNIAMNIDYESTSFSSLDLESDEDFRSTLRSWCGLFVSIHHDKIYFLHQTAREFLLMESSRDDLSAMRWHLSISSEYAHRVLAELCITRPAFGVIIIIWQKKL
ncbi:unnamed protein product [Clonostachys rosea]|uniref:NACHT domain-containing protein n=1 Tax=Bionectria ochroleuca TaxID=29856 RepID=A0ABY6TVD8_BIOOC|nr:unnamed protein product [Clonostachys rosea]